MTDHNRIVEQRERVEAAYQAWMRSESAYEEAAWIEYQAEQMKMDALIKREKVRTDEARSEDLAGALSSGNARTETC